MAKKQEEKPKSKGGAPKGNQNALGNEGGRPTEYKEEYALLAFRYCLLGSTDADLAEAFEVSESTINEWKKKHVEFSESIYAGKEKADMKVVGELYKGAADRMVTEQQAFKVKRVFWDDKGRRCEQEEVVTIDVQKVLPADFRNQQFWLKNRRSDKWRDNHNIDHTSKGEKIDNGPVLFLSADELTEEQIQDYIKKNIEGDSDEVME